MTQADLSFFDDESERPLYNDSNVNDSSATSPSPPSPPPDLLDPIAQVKAQMELKNPGMLEQNPVPEPTALPASQQFDQLQPPRDNPLLETFPEGPNHLSSNQKSHKDIPKEIMAVYHRLGGTEWLIKMAIAYPKEFLGMIKPLIPKDISIHAEIQGIQLAIIDTFNTPDMLLTREQQELIVDGEFQAEDTDTS